MSPFELLIKLSPIQYGWWDEEKQKVITWKDPEFNFEEGLHSSYWRKIGIFE